MPFLSGTKEKVKRNPLSTRRQKAVNAINSSQVYSRGEEVLWFYYRLRSALNSRGEIRGEVTTLIDYIECVHGAALMTDAGHDEPEGFIAVDVEPKGPQES